MSVSLDTIFKYNPAPKQNSKKEYEESDFDEVDNAESATSPAYMSDEYEYNLKPVEEEEPKAHSQTTDSKIQSLPIITAVKASLSYFPEYDAKAKHVQSAKMKSKEFLPILDYLNKKQVFSICSYIEQNKKNLLKASKEAQQPIYLRPDVSPLPLGVLISPSGQVFLLAKRKAKKDSLVFYGGSKIVKEAINYDNFESFMSLTMKIDSNNEITAVRDILNSNLHKKVNYLAKTHLVFSYPDKNNYTSKIMLIQDFYNDGNLETAIKNQRFNESQKLEVARKFIYALYTLHGNNLIHFDIKPDNIFLRGDELVIGDTSSITARGNLNGVSANIIYAPPEVKRYVISKLEDPPHIAAFFKKEIGDGTPTDIFAAGLTLYQLFTGASTTDLPWQTLQTLPNLEFNQKTIAMMGAFHSKLPRSTPIECIIADMLNPNPLYRPSAQKVYEGLSELDSNTKMSLEESSRLPRTLSLSSSGKSERTLKRKFMDDSEFEDAQQLREETPIVNEIASEPQNEKNQL